MAYIHGSVCRHQGAPPPADGPGAAELNNLFPVRAFAGDTIEDLPCGKGLQL